MGEMDKIRDRSFELWKEAREYASLPCSIEDYVEERLEDKTRDLQEQLDNLTKQLDNLEYELDEERCQAAFLTQQLEEQKHELGRDLALFMYFYYKENINFIELHGEEARLKAMRLKLHNILGDLISYELDCEPRQFIKTMDNLYSNYFTESLTVRIASNKRTFQEINEAEEEDFFTPTE